MTLEKEIKSVIEKKLKDGTIEELVEKHFIKGVEEALDNLFRRYGDVTKMIEGKLKDLMISHIEKFDFHGQLVKLDEVLKTIAVHSSGEQKKLLDNFQEYMIPLNEQDLSAAKVFEKYKEYVSHNVETDDLEVITEESIYYENVDVSFALEKDESRSSFSMERGALIFSCDQDESMNEVIPVSRWSFMKEGEYDIDYPPLESIGSLRTINDFQLFVLKMKNAGVSLHMDIDGDYDDVEVEKEPEPSY